MPPLPNDILASVERGELHDAMIPGVCLEFVKEQRTLLLLVPNQVRAHFANLLSFGLLNNHDLQRIMAAFPGVKQG